MIEEQQGLAFLNSLIEESHLPSEGAYTQGGNYDPAEIHSILVCLERRLGIPEEFLLRSFGEYLLLAMVRLYPGFFDVKNLKAFLLSVDRHIHVEVDKLYPDSEMPQFGYLDEGGSDLIIYYRSKKKLCALAEGLISGASRYFDEECSLIHSTCLHRGDHKCTFELTIYDKKQ